MAEPLDFSKLPDVSELHPELGQEERWFAAHMKAREDALEAVFGKTEPPGQILSPSDPDLEINWPGGGIHQYRPAPGREGWHYVTHGLAQPESLEEVEAGRDDPDPLSGLGIELVVSTPSQGLWAAEVLLLLVRYLLFDEDARVFLPGHRISAGVLQQLHPHTNLTHILGLSSPEYPGRIRLPAGECLLVHLVGITAGEAERAKSLPGTSGSKALCSVLFELGVGAVTDPTRSCLTQDPAFEGAWQRASLAAKSGAE